MQLFKKKWPVVLPRIENWEGFGFQHLDLKHFHHSLTSDATCWPPEERQKVKFKIVSGFQQDIWTALFKPQAWWGVCVYVCVSLSDWSSWISVSLWQRVCLLGWIFSCKHSTVSFLVCSLWGEQKDSVWLSTHNSQHLLKMSARNVRAQDPSVTVAAQSTDTFVTLFDWFQHITTVEIITSWKILTVPNKRFFKSDTSASITSSFNAPVVNIRSLTGRYVLCTTFWPHVWLKKQLNGCSRRLFGLVPMSHFLVSKGNMLLFYIL